MTETAKAKLREAGWNYTGLCPCSVPSHKFLKGDYKIMYSRTRDLWNLFQGKSKVAISWGNESDLLQKLTEKGL